MNLTSSRTSNAPLFLLAAHRSHSPTPETGIAGVYHDGLGHEDSHGHHMDRAIGYQESFDAAISLQSGLIEMFEQATWYTPAVCNLLDMAAQAVKACLDLQLIWLSMMAPQAVSRAEATSHHLELVPCGGGPGDRGPHTVEGFEYSMDIAIGADPVFASEGSSELAFAAAA